MESASKSPLLYLHLEWHEILDLEFVIPCEDKLSQPSLVGRLEHAINTMIKNLRIFDTHSQNVIFYTIKSRINSIRIKINSGRSHHSFSESI